MADLIASKIVETALSVMKSHPQTSALEILDLGRHGGDLDFEAPEGAGEFGDWTDAASPFGELLRQAFAAEEIGPEAAKLWASTDPTDDAAADALVTQWQAEVMERFAARYKLWGCSA